MSTDGRWRKRWRWSAWELTLEDFQSLPLAPGQANIEPGDGNVLVRVRTNVYVRTGTQDLTTTVLGQPVQVRAPPVRYSWNFGDGSASVVTTDAGDPYPELRVTHAYPDAGSTPSR